MRYAHSVEQVRAAEHASVFLADGTLMQRAAAGLATAVIDFLGGAYGRRVLLLVGPGDNGGDALFAGARLARRGARVEAVLLGSRVHEAGLAALRAAGGWVRPALLRAISGSDGREPGCRLDGEELPPRAQRTAASRGWDVVVDGIVGIGGRPGLQPEIVATLEELGVLGGSGPMAGVPVVAVDVPSGIDVDTGRLDGPHVRATLTVTFGTHKIGHLVDPAAEACGAVHLVDIGLDLPPAPVESLQAADVAALIRVPGPFAHKYTRGVVGVRAGSATYPGAGLLCVAGASCGLAGMVRYRPVDDDRPTADAVRTAHPEVVAGAGRVQAWVVGSGGGDQVGHALETATADTVPMVVDADALGPWGALAATRASGGGPSTTVLTPHAGELAAMLGVERAQVESDQLAHARLAAARFGAVVLLKNRHTITAHPDGRARVTTTGRPWLASAGAGDVLAGLTGALLATGLEPFDAASVASWVHGAAATRGGEGGPVTAAQVAAALPATLRDLLREHGPDDGLRESTP